MSNEQWPITDESIHEAFASMLRDGSWGRYHGPHGEQLVEQLREFHAVGHVHLCASGTNAVELALRGVGVRPGDEVILAAYDFKSNFINVLTLGAVPVLIDTLPGKPVPDPEAIQAALTERTRAVICSHLHGHCADIHRIREIVAPSGLPVIEDACQAHGALIRGQRAGAVGDVGVLSFGGSKLLTAGRGGAVLTNDNTIAQRIRLYVNRGNDAYPLSEMQAAVLLPQLRQLDNRNRLRLQNVRLLTKLMENQGGPRSTLELPNSAVPPHDPESAETRNSPAPTAPSDVNAPVFYKLAFLAQHSTDRSATENLASDMRARGVELAMAFPALHTIHGRSRFRAIGNLPNATELNHRLMILHHPILLASAAEIANAASVLSARRDQGDDVPPFVA